MVASSKTTPGSRWRTAGALLVLLVVALLVYRPWRPTPFDILDFSEFLPLLQGADGVGDRLVTLVQYYAGEHGRLNVLSYAALALKWSIFGDNPVLWQLARFLQMGLVVVGVFWLFRSLGLASAGAVAGASLFVAADAAMEGWIRLTMGEPLGLLLALWAALLAAGYQRAPSWRRTGLAVAALLGGALLAKEMLVGVVPFVLLLAVFHQGDGAFRWSGWTERTRWLLAVSGITLGAVVAAIGIVALLVPTDGFTALYGEGTTTVSRLGRALRRMTLPALTYLRGARAITDPPNLIFVVLVTAGMLASVRFPGTRKRTTILGVAGVALPLVGAVLYLPWPQYHGFYGMPFMLGPALLLAVAVDGLYREAPRVRWAIAAAALLLLVTTGSTAQQVAARTAATRVVNAGLAGVVLEASAVDSFIVVVGGRADQAWQGTGATLERYAKALRPGALAPAGVEATCPELSAPGAILGTVLILVPQGSCAVDGAVVRVVTGYYRYASWRDLVVVPDSMWSEVYLVEDRARSD
jgi:hypothetical protein